MTQQTSGRAPGAGPAAPAGPPGTADPTVQGGGTAQVAREEAAEVTRTGAEAGKQVASTAAEQVGEVTQEARRQAGDLLQHARGQVADQATAGQQKAAEGLRSVASELHQMAGSSGGPASDLAAQAASRIEAAADWLDRRGPGDLLEEVRRFARRRPGAFLAGAAVAGVLVGRLTRGAVDASRDSGPGTGRYGPAGGPQPPAPGYGTAQPPGAPAGQPWTQPPPPPPGPPAGGYGPGAPPPPGYETPYPAPGAGGPTGWREPGTPAGTPGVPGPGPAPAGPGAPGAGPPPGYPPDRPSAAGPPPETQATTVGEYVEELERGARRDPDEQGGRR